VRVKQLVREVDSNFATFGVVWRGQLAAAQSELAAHNVLFTSSYRRLVSLQAWRSTLLEPRLSEGSLAFFREAQNDALVSHTLAQLGSWRSALKSLRSLIENALVALYYMDHPVELRLWDAGKQRLGFAGSLAYLKSHPDLAALKPTENGLEVLEQEYSTLSRAVHASARSFRMTGDVSTAILWSGKAASARAWSTREALVVQGLNLVLMSLFRDDLKGTRLPNLRKAISLAMPSRRIAKIRTSIGVSLYRHPGQ
jgi:hypothetical protein